MATKTDTQGLVITTTSDFDIVMTRKFKAPARLLFDAWTKPEHVRRWFGPADWELDVCDIDLRVGGKYRFHMRKREGSDGGEYAHVEEMGIYGEYTKIDAPTHLANTEVFEEPYFEEMGAGTLNTLDFHEKDGITTQVGVSVYKTKEQRDAVLSTGFAEGAEESFRRLDELLRTLAQA